ncbi:MAG: hypothetical protein K8R87_06640 [Verrucomicrobia bacterium]|nr:hypothetical protein [Verrucomicrobiota bacterium]
MNFLKRLWQKRWLHSLAWTAVSLITLYILLCTWLNWSWGRQWAATTAMLKTEGETLDFRAVANDPVPEADNFCAIPLLKDLALVVDNDTSKGMPGENRKRLDAIKLPSESKKAGTRPRLANASLGKAIDLKAWAEWLRKEGSLNFPDDSGNAARDLLGALAKDDAVVQELAAGLNRSKAQWTPEWKTRELPERLFTIPFPHYTGSRNTNQTLALRAIAAARASNTAKAHETALIMARLVQANLHDPFLIGMLVAASDTATLCSSTWELCDAQAGTAEDFARLEASLTELDFHRSALRALRVEMAAGVNMLKSLKRNPSSTFSLVQMTNNDDGLTTDTMLGKLAGHAIPLGFFDASAAVLAEQEFKHLIKPLRDQGWRQARQAAQDWEKELVDMKEKIWTHPTNLMACLIAPALSKIINKASYTQTLANQAVIACVLERHRIEKGSYPASLDTLRLADGKPLPLDVMNEKPMGYRKTADGRYALWSVGFDGKDDGGKRMLDKKMPENTRFSDEKYLGDWVWDFPAK